MYGGKKMKRICDKRDKRGCCKKHEVKTEAGAIGPIPYVKVKYTYARVC